MIPLPNADVVHYFGDPAPLMRSDGQVSSAWPLEILATFALPAPLQLSYGPGVAMHVSCHKRIVPFLEAAFRNVFLNAEAWADLDDYGGCYQWRSQRGARSLSRHAWGIAVDVDAKDNPQGSPPHMHPATIVAFEAQGFVWGGNFHGSRVDGMHFEFADVAKLTPAAAA